MAGLWDRFVETSRVTITIFYIFNSYFNKNDRFTVLSVSLHSFHRQRMLGLVLVVALNRPQVEFLSDEDLRNQSKSTCLRQNPLKLTKIFENLFSV
jgi:hypothetical protein